MSIETNPNLTNAEVDARISDIEYAERGERIATIVDNITVKRVPSSLEEAEKLVDILSKYNGATQAEIAADPSIKEKIGADFVDDLNDVADKGIDNWRLSKEERAERQAVLDTHKSKSALFPPRMRSLMETLSNEDGADTTAKKVIRLRSHVKKSLELDDAITEKYGEYVEPDTDNSYASRRVTRDAGASPYATGDGMIQISEKAADIRGGGSVTSGAGSDKTSRRANREATKLKVVDLVPKGITHRRDDIDDLIALDKTGRARYESGVDKNGRTIKGRFMTTHELDAIAANQELIRDGLAGRNETLKPAKHANAKKVAKLERPANYPPEDWATRSKKDKKRTIKASELIEVQDATETERTGKLNLIRNLGHRAAANAVVGMGKVAEYYQDAEKGKRRTLTTKLILGATAVIGAGVTFAAMKNGMSSPNGGRLVELAQNKPHDVAGKHAALVEAQPLGAFHNGKVAEHAQTVHDSVKLHSGDTIWGESRQTLVAGGNRHPSNAQITEEMNRIMKLNDVDEEKAKHLRVGFKLKLH